MSRFDLDKSDFMHFVNSVQWHCIILMKTTRLSEDIDESEAICPIKMKTLENKEEVVYLSRTREGTIRSKMVIDRLNELKMKLGSKVTLRKAGKTKVDSEISNKSVNSAGKKSVEEGMDM